MVENLNLKHLHQQGNVVLFKERLLWFGLCLCSGGAGEEWRKEIVIGAFLGTSSTCF